MSRLLSELLGASEPGFTQHITELERASGDPGVDLRLTSDISKRVHQKLRELGLDPADTKGLELYHALQALIQKHDQYLAENLGAKDTTNSQEIIHLAVGAILNLQVPQTCWALKHSTAKRLLKQLPPKHVMKQLRYRSVDSLLKRANLDEVFAAIYFAEPKSWRERLVASYKQLGPSDFESRQVSVIEINPKRWGDVAGQYLEINHHNIIRVNELGVVAVLPLPVEKLPGLTLTLLPLIIYHINKIRSLSSYLKLIQVKPGFGQHFVKAVSGSLRGVVTLHGRPLSWETVHKHFGRGVSQPHPDVFAPHIQPEDLLWQQAEDVLFRIEPALKFWEGLDFVAAPFKTGPVPLGLLDNAISYCNQLEYGEQSVHYFRESLRRELFMRYMEQPSIEDHVTKQFDDNFVTEDQFMVAERGLR